MTNQIIYTKADWAEFIPAMHSGETLEIDAEIFWYFLEVLPPAFMPFHDAAAGRKCSFAFAEGAEPVVAFWHDADEKHYYCRQTNIMNPHA